MNNDINDIEVSVCITTYFHENYIKQAIDSVLKQKFNKRIEICISDDCSKDGTVNVLKEYERNYEFIRLNLNRANIGLTKNMFIVKTMARGRYLVMLSGDDYYIDEYKLQKQYDFLINNPEYFGVATSIEVRKDNDDFGKGKFPPKKYRDREFTLQDFLKGKSFPLSGMMYKNVLSDKKMYDLLSQMPNISRYIDDVTDSIFLLQIGRVYVLSDCCTAYRVRAKIKGDKNFNSSNKGLSSYTKHIDMLNNLYNFFEGKVDLFYRYYDVIKTSWIKSIILKKHKDFIAAYRTTPIEYRKRGLLIKSVIWDVLTLPKRAIGKIGG